MGKKKITIIYKTPNVITINTKVSSGGSGAQASSLFVGDDPFTGITDELKVVRDNLGVESNLSLSTSKTEVANSAIIRATTNPTLRLIADNANNPSTGENMGNLRFTRNFEDPLALDLARAIYADFSERVVADGGTVEGSGECVANELELIVSGQYLINMVDIRPVYSGTLGSTKADLVFYLNDGTGAPIERFRINTEGDIEVKDPSKGIILRSENNTAYRIVVGNTGTLAAIPLTSTAPSITTLPTISGTLNVGETLTATAGTTSGVPTPTRVLQWQRSDNGTTGWADISGATGTTYLLGFNDEDKYIRVAQTEENILGTATANSVSTGQIQPALFSGLLDDYPNAAAAYSLRKLRILYSGDAIVVRRASDNTTQSIGFDALTNELDTASLESFCSGTDGFVTTWYDQSGSGNDATQASASAQPKIVSSGSTILENGKAAVSFDGNDDYIQTYTISYTQPHTIFDVRRYYANKTQIGISLKDADSSFADSNIGGEFRSFYGSYIPNVPIQDTNQGLWYSLGNGATSAIALDGATASVGQGGSEIVNRLTMGRRGSSGLNAAIILQEVVFYDSNESTNRSGIETNINDYYSIY